MIKVEIQHFEGCPNGPAMIENVKKALESFDGDVEYKDVHVEDRETAEKVGFRGSPTLLINGADFEDMPAPEHPAMTCRFYKDGVPGAGQILEKLKAAGD